MSKENRINILHDNCAQKKQFNRTHFSLNTGSMSHEEKCKLMSRRRQVFTAKILFMTWLLHLFNTHYNLFPNKQSTEVIPAQLRDILIGIIIFADNVLCQESNSN